VGRHNQKIELGFEIHTTKSPKETQRRSWRDTGSEECLSPLTVTNK